MRQGHVVIDIKRCIVGATVRNALAHELRHPLGVIHSIRYSKSGKTAHILSLSVGLLFVLCEQIFYGRTALLHALPRQNIQGVYNSSALHICRNGH